MTTDVGHTILRCLSEIAPDRDPATIDPRADLREALDLDSMDFLRFAQALHRELGVEIPESDYPRIATLEACIAECTRRSGSSP